MRWVGLSSRRFGLPAALLAAVALAGCSTNSSNNTAVVVSGNTLRIYVTQPPGAQTAVDVDVLDAEKLALQQAGSHSGKYALALKVVHNPEVSADARTAIADNKAIAYLGEVSPGTSGASVQITNQLGLLQISPTDTAVYLTQPTAAVPGSPTHWYPDHGNFGLTFSRVVPNTSKEAHAVVAQMKTLQLTKLYVASDASAYGKSVALEVRQDAPSAGLSVVTAAAGADAVFYAGAPNQAATKAIGAAAAASPAAKLFVPSAFYDDAWVAGLSAAAQKQLYVSSPGFMPGSYQGTGAAFVSAFKQAYGHQPQPQAVFGYAAMQALLAGLKQAGGNADSRADVTDDVLGLKNQSSALGTYSLDGGDTNIAPFIFARPVAGKLVPAERGETSLSGRTTWRPMAAGLLSALLALTVLVGCDGTTPASNRIRGSTLSVYVSLPLIGPSRSSGEAVLNGVRMALAAAHGAVGRYRVVLHPLDDATVSSRGWNPGQTTVNARAAIKNPSTIGYLGDLNSGATAVAIPLLNRGDVPQISPTSTAVGLTEGGLESAPGEPEKYYTTKKRTFMRVIPSDRIQSAVQVQLQNEADCDRIVVLDDGEVDGTDAAVSFDYAAQRAGLKVVSTIQYDPNAANYAALAKGIAKQHPTCVMISALPQSHPVALTEAVARTVPDADLFATAGLAEPSYVDPTRGGIPVALDSRVTITAGMLGPQNYPPAGQRFLRAYLKRYGTVQSGAIFGYAAMSLLLHAIRAATAQTGHQVTRSSVLEQLMKTRDLPSVLGTYSINSRGDTTLDRFGVYHVVGGQLIFWQARRG